jgi:hypothetical protein
VLPEPHVMRSDTTMTPRSVWGLKTLHTSTNDHISSRKRTKSKSKTKARFRGRGLYQSPVFGPRSPSPIPSWSSKSKSKFNSNPSWASKSKSKSPKSN